MRIIQPTAPPPLEQDMQTTAQDDEGTGPNLPIDQFLHLSEHSPLLIGGPEAARPALEETYGAIRDGDEVEDASKPDHLHHIDGATWPGAGQWGVRDLIADWQGFWIFGILVALVIGPGEMTIASIGSILTSLLPSPTSLLPSPTSLLPSPTSLFTTTFSYSTPQAASDTNPLKQRNTQVFLISLSSTLFRLLTGLLADYLSPPPTAVPNPAYHPDQDDPFAPTPPEAVDHTNDDRAPAGAGTGAGGGGERRAHAQPPHLWKQIKKVKMSRAAMTATCALLLGAVYVFGAAGLQGKQGQGGERLWVLSIGVGAMYGALFTLTVCSSFFSPPFAQFQSFSFLFRVAEDVCGGVARDCITSFRPDQFWFSMGYDFVFYCIRIGRLFRTSLSLSPSLPRCAHLCLPFTTCAVSLRPPFHPFRFSDRMPWYPLF